MSSFKVLPPRSNRSQYAGVTPYDEQLSQETSPGFDPVAHGAPTMVQRTSYEPMQQSEALIEHKNVDFSSRPFQDVGRPKAQPKRSLAQRFPRIIKAIRALLVYVIVGVILLIPILATRDAREDREGTSAEIRKRNTVYYIFVMLIQAWLMSGVFYALAMLMPYIFRLVAHYVNPAHERYWRIWIMMRLPFIALFAVVSLAISMYTWLETNDDLSAYYNVPGATEEERQLAAQLVQETINTVSTVLIYFCLWAGVYFLEKCLIVYMTIHFHYRAHNVEILRSKRLVDALVALYTYSCTVYPRGHSMFSKEDYIIDRDHKSLSGKRSIGQASLGSADLAAGNFAQAFGVVFGSEASSHWFSPSSTYAVVNRALQQPAASAALAKRVWTSLVSEQSTVLTPQDIKDVLADDAKATEYFETLDQNENGDVTLGEMVDLLVDAGTKRQSIYKSMNDMTHVINTVDWIMLGILALVILFLVLVSQIPLLMNIKDLIGFSVLGLGFVVGRTLHEFVQGAIFTILDHPYDVGDVVEIYTLNERQQVLLSVTRISLLYTTFEELGTGKSVQYANMRSKIKRINNLSRSGKNKEAILFSVDHNTSFKDIELFKQEMISFVTSPENSRDYDSNINVRVAGIGCLDKMDIKVSFRHKSNFANDGLRAVRSSRMYCAIMAATRKVPMYKPGQPSLGASLGDAAKPQYTVMLTQDEAAERKKAKETDYLSKRMDYAEEKVEDEKAVLAAAEEAAAVKRMMGISGLTSERLLSPGSVDQEQFTFIHGDERGLRMRRQYH